MAQLPLDNYVVVSTLQASGGI